MERVNDKTFCSSCLCVVIRLSLPSHARINETVLIISTVNSNVYPFETGNTIECGEWFEIAEEFPMHTVSRKHYIKISKEKSGCFGIFENSEDTGSG